MEAIELNGWRAVPRYNKWEEFIGYDIYNPLHHRIGTVFDHENITVRLEEFSGETAKRRKPVRFSELTIAKSEPALGMHTIFYYYGDLYLGKIQYICRNGEIDVRTYIRGENKWGTGCDAGLRWMLQENGLEWITRESQCP